MNKLDFLLKYQVDHEKYKDVLIIIPFMRYMKYYIDKNIDKSKIRRIEYSRGKLFLNDGKLIRFLTPNAIENNMATGLRFEEVMFYE